VFLSWWILQRRNTHEFNVFPVTFTVNGKRGFLPRDQVFPLHVLVFNCSFLLQKMSSFTVLSAKRIVLEYFYLLIFYFEKFSTPVCPLP